MANLTEICGNLHVITASHIYTTAGRVHQLCTEKRSLVIALICAER
jgi:hypothetical protein